MNKIDMVIEKLMNQTVKKEIRWDSFSIFPTDENQPFYGHSEIDTIESYSYHYAITETKPDGSVSPTFNGGYFFLATFKTTTLNNEQITKLKFGFKQSFGDIQILSENQEKLFELKTLIEYEEPVKETTISDILADFLNDKD